MKVSIRNQQRLVKANQQKITGLLRKALRHLGLRRAEISVLLVSDRRMRVLNRTYRRVDRTTDVLSFPQTDAGFRLSDAGNHHLLLGDIVINLHKAKRQASEYGTSFHDELSRLLVHGLLHLIHYDHEINRYQKERMETKERELTALLK
ncbi:MAG: rRNA maturation RNase YbeY [Nitrospirota bacterium]